MLEEPIYRLVLTLSLGQCLVVMLGLALGFFACLLWAIIATIAWGLERRRRLEALQKLARRGREDGQCGIGWSWNTRPGIYPGRVVNVSERREDF